MALFCAPRNHFVALRNFAAADRARSSTLMRDSESKNAFSAVAKIEPTAPERATMRSPNRFQDAFPHQSL